MSTGTPTPFAQLNQWNPYDKVRMEDFNRDNQKLDTTLQSIVAQGGNGGGTSGESVVFTAHATYGDGMITLSEAFPEIFTVRFIAPADYVVGDKLFVDGMELEVLAHDLSTLEAGAYKAGMLLTLDVDRVGGKAYYTLATSGGGEGPGPGGPGTGEYGILPPQTHIDVTGQDASAVVELMNAGGNAFAGTLLVCKEGTEMPQSTTDGIIQNAGIYIPSVEIKGLTNEIPYTVRAFAYNHNNEYQTDVVNAVETFYPKASNAGLSWVLHDSGNINNWTSVIYGNGMFVAVSGSGDNYRIKISYDGIVWHNADTPAPYVFRDIAFGNGTFAAVGSYGAIMTSTDGKDWTLRTTPIHNQSWYKVAYGSGMFVAVSFSDQLMRSEDGISWTPFSVSGKWLYISYGNNLFVAGAGDGSNRIMTSPDGVNWTSRNSQYGGTKMAYGNGMFVSIYKGYSVCVMTSYDGIEWTHTPLEISSSNFQCTAYGNGLFVSVAADGNHVLTSPDGITWTARQCEEQVWNSVVYGGGKFVAVGSNGALMTSP